MAKDISELTAYLETIAKGVRVALLETADRVRVRMSEDGAPSTRPVQWDSERQRRFVLAKLRREGNLPYRRTNQYRLGWKVERVPFGATLSNEHPAGAIGGTVSGWQSKIHRGRWPHLLTVLFDELSKLPNEISNQVKVLSG